MINHIGKITIYVENQQEARNFWVDKVGFVVRQEQKMGSGFTWLEVAPSKEAVTTLILYEKQVMLSQNKNANVSHPNVLLSCSDIENTYETLKGNGVEVGELQNMPYGKMFLFKDQDKNQYVIRED